ncbi:MAG TPA: hypothetical protein VLG48_10150 [Candidatus Methylomirabilis sp.]|nr:hypothetical protein [Candidatus Methylomirabilis sp.]
MLNLTAFATNANLLKLEPEMLERWGRALRVHHGSLAHQEGRAGFGSPHDDQGRVKVKTEY